MTIMVLFFRKGKWVCLTIVGRLSHSDESMRRGSTSRRVLYITNETRELLQGLRPISISPVTIQRQRLTRLHRCILQQCFYPSKGKGSVVICSVLCMYASHCKASVFRGYVEHKQWMQWKNWQNPCPFSKNVTVLFLSCWTHVLAEKMRMSFHYLFVSR